MKMPCPTPDELARLLDGEVAERRAATLRQHADSCPACQAELRRGQRLLTRIAAPLADARPADVAGVMRRLGTRPVLSAPSARSRWKVAAMALSALAASVCVLTLIPKPEQTGFQARGDGAAKGWAHQVGVDFHAMRPDARRLEKNTPVPRDTPLLGSYRNADTTGAVYLLAFAVDARGAVHWLYPGYTEAGQNPASLLLAPRRDETPLPETVVLDAPAPGPARLLTVLSREPLHVSDIESLPADKLSTDALRAHFGARIHVREWPILFTP
jgi:hypothetical protein